MGLLDGKVAIVTGAGRGIGRGEALHLAAAGARVVVNDLGGSVNGGGADTSPAEKVVSIIRARGGDAVANFDDVGDHTGAKRIVDQAVEAFGTLDVVVNNAGILRDRMIFSMSEEDFDAVIRVHLKGTWNMVHHASVYWRERSKSADPVRAAVINTVSSAGLHGQAGQSNYGAAKAAIAALTIIASVELSRYGVRVNAVTPGGSTRIVGQAIKDVVVREAEEFTEFDAMNPGNAAPMVVWLASDEALHVTGQVFRAIGNTIGLYKPWTLDRAVDNFASDGSPAQWDPHQIGAAVNGEIFGSRAVGLRSVR